MTTFSCVAVVLRLAYDELDSLRLATSPNCVEWREAYGEMSKKRKKSTISDLNHDNLAARDVFCVVCLASARQDSDPKINPHNSPSFASFLLVSDYTQKERKILLLKRKAQLVAWMRLAMVLLMLSWRSSGKKTAIVFSNQFWITRYEIAREKKGFCARKSASQRTCR